MYFDSLYASRLLYCICLIYVEVLVTWLLMVRLLLSSSQKLCKNVDLDLSSNMLVIGFQIEQIIGYLIGQNVHISASFNIMMSIFFQK